VLPRRALAARGKAREPDGAHANSEPRKKFTEPVALSSTQPAGRPLPRRALRQSFDLVALRARCKEHRTPEAGAKSRSEARRFPQTAEDSSASAEPRPSLSRSRAASRRREESSRRRSGFPRSPRLALPLRAVLPSGARPRRLASVGVPLGPPRSAGDPADSSRLEVYRVDVASRRGPRGSGQPASFRA